MAESTIDVEALARLLWEDVIRVQEQCFSEARCSWENIHDSQRADIREIAAYGACAAIRAFVERVERRVEAGVRVGDPFEGSYWQVMKAEVAALEGDR